MVFFGASAAFAQREGVQAYFCLHTTDTAYMKVVVRDLCQFKSLWAKAIQLKKGKKPSTFEFSATSQGISGKYEYFQSLLNGQNGMQQTTWAVREDGKRIYASLTDYKGNLANVSTDTYRCKPTPFN